MEDCIFCKIVNGSIPSAKIWEDGEFLAILDAFPNTKGMTLVMPKKHFNSYVFSMHDMDYSALMLATKNAAKLIKKSLKVERVTMVMEGQGVNHAHIKLYPMHGLGEAFENEQMNKEVFFEKYPGYTNTSPGPKADMDGLQKLAEEIKNSI